MKVSKFFAQGLPTGKVNLQMAQMLTFNQSGTKAFSALSVIPFDRFTSKEKMKAKLVERGGMVEGYAGIHYRAYNGIGWRLDESDQIIKWSVKGRVVLDAYGWDQFVSAKDITPSAPETCC